MAMNVSIDELVSCLLFALTCRLILVTLSHVIKAYYMVYSGYTTNSLHACCQYYYSSWDAFRCSGVTDTIPNGYYPAWGTTSSEVKCLASSENTPTPAYIVQNLNGWVENDIESCCSAHYDWAKIECIVNSGGTLSSATPAANQWFVDWASEKVRSAASSFVRPMKRSPQCCCLSLF